MTIYHLRTDDEYNSTKRGSGEPPSTKSLVNGYTTFSSTHGIPQVDRSRGRTKKAIWVLVTLAGTVCLLFNLVTLVLRYRDFPIVTKVTLEHKRSLPFPAVTICNTNPIKSSKAIEEPRILALLESWGVVVNGSIVAGRKKRHSSDSGSYWQNKTSFVQNVEDSPKSPDGNDPMYHTWRTLDLEKNDLDKDAEPTYGADLEIPVRRAIGEDSPDTAGRIDKTIDDRKSFVKDIQLSQFRNTKIFHEFSHFNEYSNDRSGSADIRKIRNNLNKDMDKGTPDGTPRFPGDNSSILKKSYDMKTRNIYTNRTRKKRSTAGELPGYTFHNNQDCAGSDIASLRTRSAADCSWHCSINKDCYASAFGLPYSCWLKWQCPHSVLKPHRSRFTYTKNDPATTLSLHTVFRAARGSEENLYSIWTTAPSTGPTVSQQLTPDHLSTGQAFKPTYKSFLMECVWDKVQKVYVTFHADNEEKIFYMFDQPSSSVTDWFSYNNLRGTSFLDLLDDTQTLNYFSIKGHDERRWYVNLSFQSCGDKGWSAILDEDSDHNCQYEIDSPGPMFIYSSSDNVAEANDYLHAESFFIKVELNISGLSGECYSDCVNVTDGLYQSCLGCNVYVQCQAEVLEYFVCIEGRVFDASSSQCEDQSSTCSGERVSDSQCKPDGCKNDPCYNGGTCVITTYGFVCQCPPRFDGDLCEECADGEQLWFSWFFEGLGNLYADGILISETGTGESMDTVKVPCGTNMLALELSYPGDSTSVSPEVGADNNTSISPLEALHRFTGVLNSRQVTNLSGLVCTSDTALLNGAEDWHRLVYDDSAWELPETLQFNDNLSWTGLWSVFSDAPYVWTADQSSSIFCRYSTCTVPDLLYVAVDNQGTIYADGEELFTHDSYTEVVGVEIPCGTEVVAIKVYNEENEFGLKASYLKDSWSTGKGILVCTSDNNLVTDDWNLRGFDDTNWAIPVVQDDIWQELSGPLELIPEEAEWVWDKEGNNTMYCRQHRCDDQYILTAKGDDETTVYVDGKELIATNGQVFERRIPCGTEVVAFEITNTNGYGTFITSYNNGWVTSGEQNSQPFTLCTGNSSLLTDDWKLSSYNDSSWSVPLAIPSDDGHFTRPEGISSHADFVWHNSSVLLSANETQDKMYCRQLLTDAVVFTKEPTTQSTTLTTTSSEIPIPNNIHISEFLLDDFDNPPIDLNQQGMRRDFRKQEELFQILAEFEDSKKKSLGYTLSDMIIRCAYQGIECEQKDFDWFFDAVHGNCYVFNAGWNSSIELADRTATRTGRHYGLRLELDIGQYEYIPKVGEAAGVVVVVHPADQMPFPEDEGLVVLPGRGTGIAIRAFEMQRLPYPYGESACESGVKKNLTRNVFEELYTTKYGLTACAKTCYQTYVTGTCQCGDPQYPIRGQAFGNNSLACNVNDPVQEQCKQDILRKFTNNELECDCDVPCFARKYKYGVSSLYWPSIDYEATIMELIHSRANFLTAFDISDYRKNLVGLEVFFEDLNFEKIEELPAYQLSQLFTDLGGIIGLWLGCSLLSLFEMLELGVDLVVLLVYRYTKKPYMAEGLQCNICCHSKAVEVVPKETPVKDKVEDVRIQDDLADTEIVHTQSVTDFRQFVPRIIAKREKNKPVKKRPAKGNKVADYKDQNKSCNDCTSKYWRINPKY